MKRGENENFFICPLGVPPENNFDKKIGRRPQKKKLGGGQKRKSRFLNERKCGGAVIEVKIIEFGVFPKEHLHWSEGGKDDRDIM